MNDGVFTLELDDSHNWVPPSRDASPPRALSGAIVSPRRRAHSNVARYEFADEQRNTVSGSLTRVYREV